MLPRSILLAATYSIGAGIMMSFYTTPIYIVAFIWILAAFLGVGLDALLRNLKPRDYFKTKKGDYREDRIQEHLYSYRILYIVLPILVALLIISSPDTASFDGEFRRSFYSLQTSLLILVIIVMAFLLSDFIIKNYYFHFAKTCIKIAQRKSDRIDKIKYIFLALNSYSKYLHKRLGLQIRNLGAIQDKIARASHQETLELVDSLDKMAEGEKVDMASYLGTTSIQKIDKPLYRLRNSV